MKMPKYIQLHGVFLSPCEHQLTPALSPIWGLRPKPRRPEEVVYSPNDSCSHFTQRLFPPKLPQRHACTIFSIHSPSFILIIHHIQAIFTSFYYETNHSIISSAPPGRPTALGLLCQIHLQLIFVLFQTWLPQSDLLKCYSSRVVYG